MNMADCTTHTMLIETHSRKISSKIEFVRHVKSVSFWTYNDDLFYSERPNSFFYVFGSVETRTFWVDSNEQPQQRQKTKEQRNVHLLTQITSLVFAVWMNNKRISRNEKWKQSFLCMLFDGRTNGALFCVPSRTCSDTFDSVTRSLCIKKRNDRENLSWPAERWVPHERSYRTRNRNLHPPIINCNDRWVI